jgi:hypothetical protein
MKRGTHQDISQQFRINSIIMLNEQTQSTKSDHLNVFLDVISI